MQNFNISVSDSSGDSSNWSETITTIPNPDITVDLNGVTGRFVRITQNIDQPLSLAEVEVYGYQNAITSQRISFSEEVLDNNSSKVFENTLVTTDPFTNNFIIEIPEYNNKSNITVEVFDITGSSILKNMYYSSVVELPSASLTSGLYFLQVSYNNGMVKTKKIFKN